MLITTEGTENTEEISLLYREKYLFSVISVLSVVSLSSALTECP